MYSYKKLTLACLSKYILPRLINHHEKNIETSFDMKCVCLPDVCHFEILPYDFYPLYKIPKPPSFHTNV